MNAGRRRFDLIEVLVVMAVAVLVTYVATSKTLAARVNNYAVFGEDGLAELQPFEQRYGPGRSSENLEEWFIRDFFHDRRAGVFVDVGANDYKDKSNSYYLETVLGWSGIAVDAQPEFAKGYQLNRPRTKFLAYFISDVSGAKEQLYVPGDNKLVASSDAQFVKERARGIETRSVETISLSALLDGEHVERVDFLSIDIELAEPKALAGFDISRFQPALVCVEAHSAVRQQILDYFAAHHYVLVGKYLRTDAKNLYFKPIG